MNFFHSRTSITRRRIRRRSDLKIPAYSSRCRHRACTHKWHCSGIRRRCTADATHSDRRRSLSGTCSEPSRCSSPDNARVGDANESITQSIDRTQHSIVVRPTAVRAISTDIICQTIVQHCRTSDFELTVTCCVKLRLSLYLQIQT